MKELKRILSLVLCFVMLVSIIPTFTFQANAAEKTTTYVLAGGDFQEAGDHTGSAENVRNILAQISQKYDTMDGMLFVGDYDCETHENDDNGQTAAGITALMGAVQDSYPNINDANSILVQGNHDIKEARIDATGGHDLDGYSVFVMAVRRVERDEVHLGLDQGFHAVHGVLGDADGSAAEQTALGILGGVGTMTLTATPSL